MSRYFKTLLVPLLLIASASSVSTIFAFEKGKTKGKELKEPVTIIVSEKVTAVMAGDKKIRDAAQGTVLSATRNQGNWFYVPALKGWVNGADAVQQKDAIKVFTEKIKEENTPTAYHLRGIAQMSLKNWGKALVDLEKAYDLGEGSVALHFNLGACYRQLNDLPAAMKEFTSIIKSHPDEFPALMARASILSEQAHWEAAIVDYDAALKLNENSPDAHNSRGVALRMMGRLEEAEAEYSTAIKLDESFATAIANRAFVYKELGNFAGAVKDYESAMKINGDDVGVMNDFAWLLATCADKKTRNPKKAIKLAQKACQETDNDNGEYLDTLAAAYACNGEFDKAVKTGEQALKLLESQPTGKDVAERVLLYQKEKPFVEK